MRLAPDPYTASSDRWMGSLPAGVDWSRLEDRLIARGWYPKNAITRLRVYGCDGGHEIVIEPSSRHVVFRIAPQVAPADCAQIAEALAHVLAEEAHIQGASPAHAA
ncbi:MAG: hypothetical protein M3Y87_00305 [Myxococcota bacterium]|nr:hypothetical protein [Myxococcota bacterium]